MGAVDIEDGVLVSSDVEDGRDQLDCDVAQVLVLTVVAAPRTACELLRLRQRNWLLGYGTQLPCGPSCSN